MTRERLNGYKQQARVFQALAHPVRLRILDILAQEEACVCHLTDALKKRQAYVSQQLAVLREAGLVTDRKDGLMVYYRLADGKIPELVDIARAMLVEQMGEDALSFPPLPPQRSDTCTCPKCQTA
jgi:DNA-binding transcriptional ArsR family regulator